MQVMNDTISSAIKRVPQEIVELFFVPSFIEKYARKIANFSL